MDNNLEMIKRAKSYLEQLANGIDPITNLSVPEDTVVNNVRLNRCFFFVSDLLQKIIDNDGEIGKSKIIYNKKLPPFAITEEEKSKVELSDEPITISKLCERINQQVDMEKVRKLKVTAFGDWLVEKGFLIIEIRNDKKYKKATTAGENIGISSDWQKFGGNEYYSITYDKKAQQFLLDNLNEVLEISFK